MNATEACVALNMLPTVGPVRLRKLLEVFKSPERVLTAKRGELRQVEGIGSEVADQISSWESIVDLAAELERVREFGATVITQDSPSYPKPLREIHAPPIVLYLRESHPHLPCRLIGRQQLLSVNGDAGQPDEDRLRRHGRQPLLRAQSSRPR